MSCSLGVNKKKKQDIIIKVDFAMAYDSVTWDNLLDVIHAIGFGPN